MNEEASAGEEGHQGYPPCFRKETAGSKDRINIEVSARRDP